MGKYLTIDERGRLHIADTTHQTSILNSGLIMDLLTHLAYVPELPEVVVTAPRKAQPRPTILPQPIDFRSLYGNNPWQRYWDAVKKLDPYIVSI